MRLQKVAFLDRDGTINIDHNYVHKIEDFIFIPGALEGLKKIKDAGYYLVMVSNQSGIARGYFDICDFQNLSYWMQNKMRELVGFQFDLVLFSPGKDESDPMRKPKPAMLFYAKEILAERGMDIDMNRSFMCGDRNSDLLTGHNFGLKHNIYVSTGKLKSPDIDELASQQIDSLEDIDLNQLI